MTKTSQPRKSTISGRIKLLWKNKHEKGVLGGRGGDVQQGVEKTSLRKQSSKT